MSKATFGQALQALNLIHSKDPSLERLEALFASGILSDLLNPEALLYDRDAVRAALKLGVVLPEIITLSVDYSRSLEAMIAAGHYDCVEGDITVERFPLKGGGVEQFEAKVFYFDCDMFSEEVVAAMKAEDFDAAQIEHLLAFGEKYPGEQFKRPIKGLGSVTKRYGSYSYSYMPCLRRMIGSQRFLSLELWTLKWHGRDHGFLGVRPFKKVESSAA